MTCALGLLLLSDFPLSYALDPQNLRSVHRTHFQRSLLYTNRTMNARAAGCSVG